VNFRFGNGTRRLQRTAEKGDNLLDLIRRQLFTRVNIVLIRLILDFLKAINYDISCHGWRILDEILCWFNTYWMSMFLRGVIHDMSHHSTIRTYCPLNMTVGKPEKQLTHLVNVKMSLLISNCHLGPTCCIPQKEKARFFISK